MHSASGTKTTANCEKDPDEREGSRDLKIDIVQCGNLYLKFDWLLPQVASRGTDDWCIVRIKIDEVYVPAKFGEDGARFRAKIGLVEKATPNVKYTPPRKPATDTQNSPPAVESVEPDGQSIVELEIEFILHLLVRITELESGLLELRLVSRRGTEIGAEKILLREVANSPQLTREWGVDSGSPMLKMPGLEPMPEAMVSVSVRGLESADPALREDPSAFSPPE